MKAPLSQQKVMDAVSLAAGAATGKHGSQTPMRSDFDLCFRAAGAWAFDRWAQLCGFGILAGQVFDDAELGDAVAPPDADTAQLT